MCDLVLCCTWQKESRLAEVEPDRSGNELAVKIAGGGKAWGKQIPRPADKPHSVWWRIPVYAPRGFLPNSPLR